MTSDVTRAATSARDLPTPTGVDRRSRRQAGSCRSSSTGRPSIWRTVRERGERPGSSSRPGPKPVSCSRSLAGDEPAELTALGRLERSERAPQQRHGLVERLRRAATTTIGRRPPAGRRRGRARCRCRPGTPRRTRRRRPAACPATAHGRAAARPDGVQSPLSCRMPGRPPVHAAVAGAVARAVRALPGTPAGGPRWSTSASACCTRAQPFDHQGRGVVVERRARRHDARQHPHDEPVEHRSDSERRWLARRRSAGRGRAGRAPPSAGRRRGRWRRGWRARARSGRPRRAARRAAPGRAHRRSRPGAGGARPLDEPVGRRLLDGGAVAGVLDHPDRPLGPPLELPRLAERAAAAAPLLEGAPRHADRRPAGAAGATGAARSGCAGRARPSGRRRLGLEPRRTLPLGEIAGERHLRCIVGHRPDRVADHELAPHQRATAHHRVGRVEHLVETGPGRPRIAASVSAMRVAAIRWSGDADMSAAPQHAAASTKKRATPSAPGAGTRGRTSRGCAHRRRTRWRWRAARGSTAPS